ncbi:hypothetical protein HanHA300_Chr14g0529351 [Helianthus annuus]|nr:hypothetical protein HanHA300_Chr14g0529351 [Helianthus annuus]KAJ0656766.1 hypothetical protein HanLR1_Chr14g0539631 [Helianthus annuus]
MITQSINLSYLYNLISVTFYNLISDFLLITNVGFITITKDVFFFFFFFERQTNSILSTLGAPTGQTEYSESNPSPPPIPGKTR